MFKPVQKIYCNLLLAIFALLALSACGKSSSTALPTTVPAVATVFYSHNLVFNNSSTLLTTGYNGFGQLGTGNLINRSIPGLVAGSYPFRGGAAGGNHSVAFTNHSGAVYSWGYNASGQLGNGTTTYSAVPVRSGAITGVTALAAGAYHTLALRNDGSVWGWGSNDSGQIGNVYGYSGTPLKIVGSGAFGNISSIAANGKHSLAIARGGSVWSWGLNSLGQLGLSPSVFYTVSDPVNLSSLYTGLSAGVASIAAGAGFSYAVSRDGTLWAWGTNDNGQLGNGTIISSHIPVKVLQGAGVPLAYIVKAAGGLQHGLALDSFGNVWAWGYNHYYQLGDRLQDSYYAKQVSLPGSAVATDIRAFGTSSMAKIDGAWYGWGDNTYGQLGVSFPQTSVYTPTKVIGF